MRERHENPDNFCLICLFIFKHVYSCMFDQIVVIKLFEPFNSQIKFVVLLTVNHTILIMLVQRI